MSRSLFAEKTREWEKFRSLLVNNSRIYKIFKFSFVLFFLPCTNTRIDTHRYLLPTLTIYCVFQIIRNFFELFGEFIIPAENKFWKCCLVGKK